MIITSNKTQYQIERDDYIIISHEYSREINKHIPWQQAKINNEYCNIKVDKGVVVQIESWSGVNFMKVSTGGD